MLFTSKMHIIENNAMIGEDDNNGGIEWCIADWEYAMSLIGVLEDRGRLEVNGIVYRLFYLPPPPHNHITTI